MKIKLSTLNIMSILLVAAIMAMIFAFSAQNGVVSSQSSAGITDKITHGIVPSIESKPQDAKIKIYDMIGMIIRKFAHFAEFFALGASITFMFATFKCKNKAMRIYPVLIGALYAASDEFHQYFVPGRAAKITDVLIDTAGVIVGCAMVNIIYHLILQKRELSC